MALVGLTAESQVFLCLQDPAAWPRLPRIESSPQALQSTALTSPMSESIGFWASLSSGLSGLIS